MRIAVIFVALFAAGCSPVAPPRSMVGPACVGLAFASLTPAEAPAEPEKCCGRCGKNGLPRGKVRSGDGIAIIDCGCPGTCECKQPKAVPAAATVAPRATVQCINGACRIR